MHSNPLDYVDPAVGTRSSAYAWTSGWTVYITCFHFPSDFSFTDYAYFYMLKLCEAFVLPTGANAYWNVDHFSGQGNVARGFKARGHNIARLDIALNEADAPQLPRW